MKFGFFKGLLPYCWRCCQIFRFKVDFFLTWKKQKVIKWLLILWHLMGWLKKEIKMDFCTKLVNIERYDRGGLIKDQYFMIKITAYSRNAIISYKYLFHLLKWNKQWFFLQIKSETITCHYNKIEINPLSLKIISKGWTHYFNYSREAL